MNPGCNFITSYKIIRMYAAQYKRATIFGARNHMGGGLLIRQLNILINFAFSRFFCKLKFAIVNDSIPVAIEVIKKAKVRALLFHQLADDQAFTLPFSLLFF